jgi:hypothetical protein
MEMLRHLYFDLTASTHPGALAAMLRLMPVSQLLHGFDFPYMPPATIAPAIASLESLDGLSPDDQHAIASGNARRLLQRVGAMKRGRVRSPWSGAPLRRIAETGLGWRRCTGTECVARAVAEARRASRRNSEVLK